VLREMTTTAVIPAQAGIHSCPAIEVGRAEPGRYRACYTLSKFFPDSSGLKAGMTKPMVLHGYVLRHAGGIDNGDDRPYYWRFTKDPGPWR